MTTHAEYLAGMQLQLRTWDTQFEALVTEGRKTSGETRTAYDRRLKELRLGRKAVQKSLEAARGAKDALAAQVQAGVQATFDEMHTAIERVSTDLRALPPDGGVRKPAPIPPPVDCAQPLDEPQPVEPAAT